ncbi:HlyD family efflux transporter periplasmic adaptor subunit [Stappia sp. F7233]|uniref:HlyD family efflux transporter periplasmic adaptor subunit n=1 Tax=Stappia albiluteola TaxID=2758565 RepID=A0A839AK97_9HYPH|nr:HlyD family efflux transporter periplasmic adaptor subunit [Stappia albiluteola]MBA5779207.1 HlyD family efflux transporter periplasmic adaptor subunit [Stappia albiluteola]
MLKSLEEAREENGRSLSPLRRRAGDARLTGRGVLVFKAALQTVIVAAILFGAYQGMRALILSKPEVPVRPPRETVYVVEKARVEVGDHAPMLRLYGEVVAGRAVDLRALVGGEVIAVNDSLKAGGTVDKGAELVRIDAFAYEGALLEARANLAEAKARLVEFQGEVAAERDNLARAREQLAFASRDLERAKSLLKSGAVTERTVEERDLLVSQRAQAVDQRGNALAVAEARVTQQRAVIERQQWRLSEAERNLADTVLKAPFDAIVRAQAAEIGRLVNVNDVVAVLYDRNDLEVRLTLSDSQYGRILAGEGAVIGRPVEVQWYIGGEPVIYEAEIVRVGAEVAVERGGVDVYARVKMVPGQTPLRPGAFVELHLADRTYRSAARIPEAALFGGDHVFVIEEGRTMKRDVRVLAFDDGHIIVSGDLKTGDIVMATRLAEAGEGIKVMDAAEALEAQRREAAGAGG